MPLPEDERLPPPDHDRQGGHRAARPEPRGQLAGVVLAAHRPAEGDRRGHETGERALQMGVDAVPQLLERGRREALARRDQPRALGLPP
jgi:hypothetical protein